MDEVLLEKLGLTKGEIKVYLALNKLEEATVGPIGKHSKVSKSKIYDILDKLIEKGLVGYITKEGTKWFTANDPHMMLEYVAKKEDELEKTKAEINQLIPQLIMQRSTAKKQRVAEIYEGFHGLKAIREELMQAFKPGDTFLVWGAPKIANEKWEAWFLDFHSKREKRKVKMKILYNANVRVYGEIRKRWKYTQVKYLPNKLISPTWIDIFPEAILLVVILKQPLAFVVRDKELAKSFKAYFELMWKISEG